MESKCCQVFMPLSHLAEFIFQAVAELVLQAFGYFTARVIVPVLTFSLIHVEPGPQKKVVLPKPGRIQHHRGKLIMDAELGALIGLIFWFVIVVGAFAYFNNP